MRPGHGLICYFMPCLDPRQCGLDSMIAASVLAVLVVGATAPTGYHIAPERADRHALALVQRHEPAHDRMTRLRPETPRVSADLYLAKVRQGSRDAARARADEEAGRQAERERFDREATRRAHEGDAAIEAARQHARRRAINDAGREEAESRESEEVARQLEQRRDDEDAARFRAAQRRSVEGKALVGNELHAAERRAAAQGARGSGASAKPGDVPSGFSPRANRQLDKANEWVR